MRTIHLHDLNSALFNIKIPRDVPIRVNQLQNIEIQGVRKVSLQFQKFITKANGKADKWKLLQNETYIFKFSLPHLINLYVGTIRSTLRRYFPFVINF